MASDAYDPHEARKAEMAADLGHPRLSERALLGALLRHNDALGDVAPLLRPESFSDDGHVRTYRAILALYLAGKPADPATVADELRRQGGSHEGDYRLLVDVWHGAATGAAALHHARRVRDQDVLRSLHRAGQKIAQDAACPNAPADDVLAEAEHAIFEIATVGLTGSAVPLSVAIDEATERIDARFEHGASASGGIPTGWADLDNLLVGLQESELIVVAARPSAGKTSFGLGLARTVAVEQGLPVFFASLEQSKVELAERLLCCQGQVDSHRLRRGRLNAEERVRLSGARAVLREAPIHIDDGAGQSMLRIVANARRLRLQRGLRLVVVDYLQLVEPENRKDPRQEQVAAVSRRLKALAKELALPVVALAQLNRDAEGSRPRLSHLRESGAIEADADVVLLLHRSPSTPGAVEVLVEKQRNGPTGETVLAFRGEFMRFENFASGAPFDG